MRRIHVVMLTDVLVGGGAERLVTEVALALDGDRFERTVCVTRWGAVDQQDPAVRQTLAELAAGGVRVLGIARRGKADLLSWRPLVAFLRRHRVDVLHAHKFGANVWGVILGRVSGVPVVVAHEHTWSFEGQPVRKALDRHLIARFSDAFVAVSEEDRRRMIEVERIPPYDVVTIPNGIRRIPPSGRDVRAELGVAADAPVLVSVGMLRPQKAYDVLLRAVAALADEHPALRVLVAGGPVPTDAEEPGRLRDLSTALGIQDVVSFLGRRSDVSDLLHAADIAVVSSDFEGSPLSVMEYMAAGLPVVATSVGGIPDLIEDGVHGRLVPTRDPAALAEAIRQLIDSPEDVARAGRAARERQRAEFDLEGTAGRIADLYERLLRATRPDSCDGAG